MVNKSTLTISNKQLSLTPISLAILLTSFSASATNLISLENLKYGSKNWQHHDPLSAVYTEKEVKGQITKILPEVHDVTTYCSPEAAAISPWASDDCITAYTDAPSVNVGQSIKFKVNVNPAPQTYSIDVYRLGYYGGAGASLIQSVAPMAGVKQPDCPMNTVTGETECNWSTTYSLNVPADWTTGVYTAVLTNQTGFKTEVLFVVRDDSRVADFLYTVPVLTYAAYNNYPSWSTTTSKSLYDNSSLGANTVVGTTRAAKSSLDRPIHHQFGGWLGSDWTEIHLVAWLEKMGYNVSYTTDVDLDAMNKADLLNYKGLLFGGHSEYWTNNMFQKVEGARDAGVNLAFFGANAAHWQVRLEKSSKGNNSRSVVCYKDTGLTDIDPNTNAALKTKNFRDVGKPEQTLVGVQYPPGGWYLPNINQPPLIVKNSDHWIYDNTGLADGSAVDHLLGYEIDNLDTTYPGPKLKTPTSQTILSDAPFTSAPLQTSLRAQTSIYQAPSGAWVFGAGTMSWSWGLGRLAATPTETFENAGIQKTTENLLNKFLVSNNVNPPAAVKMFEHANYQGASQQFGVGKYRAISGQLDIVGNDTISSLTVPTGYGVKICQNEPEFGTGWCQTYTASTSFVGFFINDQTSYLEVYKLSSTTPVTPVVAATAFRDAYYSGTVQYLGLGSYRASLGQLNVVGDNNISSFFIPQGYALKACESEPENGYGRCATYTTPISFVGYTLNDRFSYLEFYKL